MAEICHHSFTTHFNNTLQKMRPQLIIWASACWVKLRCMLITFDRGTLTGKIRNIHCSRFKFHMRRHNTNLIADVVENIGLKLLFQSPLNFTQIIQMDYQLGLIYDASLMILMYCINLNLIYNVYHAKIFSVN